MILTGKHLSRRMMLRGVGAAVALPALEAMVPAVALASRVSKKVAPARMVFVYVPNGVDMSRWRPSTEGAAFDFPVTLEPLAPHRENTLVFSGLMDHNGMALGDGPGDHARAAASFLTGVHPKKTAGSDFAAGVSVDQVAAQKIGRTTRFSSLELGCEAGGLAGNCDSGYSCAYVNSISWRSPTVPNPPEVNPRAVFERLFGADEDAADPRTQNRREKLRMSILDLVADDTRKLQGDVGPTDRRKLDEYFTSIREVERQIEIAEKQTRQHTMAVPNFGRPDGIPAEFDVHARLMFDLLTVALQSDTTRIATFLMAHEGSSRAYPEIGIPEGHHGLSHHRGDPELIAKVAKINRFHMEQLAYFTAKLKSIPEHDGTLLDRTMIVYGSGISDGNRHNHDDLPVVMTGGSELLQTGRHVRYAQSVPVTNLFLSMLDVAGVPTEKLGDSQGQLNYLSGISKA
ncbi:MAG TPA: DUF1552 domain-containing protein [Bryobacteraceae bacterium]|jgi:hypothetical protein|nr:DUF1552 domain-containing protein [Bryobacteraceae bacterium]